MSYTTVYDGVVFIEGRHNAAKIIRSTKVDLGFKFGAQLKNLRDVKAELAKQVKSAGGNCIIDFQYGQRHRLLAIDDVGFWGSGKIAILPPDIYGDIVSSK
jgi:hypothetical protein